MNDQTKTIDNITSEDILNALSDENIVRDTYNTLPVIIIEGDEYAVAKNEQEADEAVYAYVDDTLWAFCPSFLAEQTGLPVELFEFLSNKDCDDNKIYRQLIESKTTVENFADEAIAADGRGHFLASYDGEEIEVGNYLLYRIS